MKNYLLFTLLFAFLFSCTKKEESKNTTIDLQYIEDYPTEVQVARFDSDYNYVFDTITVNNADQRKISFEIVKPQMAGIIINKQERKFFVEPGTDLTINKTEEAVLKFKGKTAQENAFLERLIHDVGLEKHKWNASAKSVDDFKMQLDYYFQYKDSLLNEYVSPNSFFAKYMEIEDKANRNTKLLLFIDGNIPKGELQKEYEKNIDLSLSKFEEVNPYLGGQLLGWFYRGYAKYLQLKQYGEKYDATQKKVGTYKLNTETYAKNYEAPIRDLCISEAVMIYSYMYRDGYGFSTPKEFLFEYKEHIPKITFEKQLAALEMKEKREKEFEKGQPMLAYTFQNQEEKAVSFWDANDTDKMTLIDVWASWCGSCVKNFPRVNELEEKYSDKIQVVSISVDDDFASYKKAVVENDVPGLQKLYAENGFDSEFAEYFMVKALPRYILLDKDGKVINSSIKPNMVEEKYLK